MDLIAHGFNFLGNAPFDVEAKQILIEMVLLMARIPGKEAPTLGARRKDKASIAPGCTMPWQVGVVRWWASPVWLSSHHDQRALSANRQSSDSQRLVISAVNCDEMREGVPRQPLLPLFIYKGAAGNGEDWARTPIMWFCCEGVVHNQSYSSLAKTRGPTTTSILLFVASFITPALNHLEASKKDLKLGLQIVSLWCRVACLCTVPILNLCSYFVFSFVQSTTSGWLCWWTHLALSWWLCTRWEGSHSTSASLHRELPCCCFQEIILDNCDNFHLFADVLWLGGK